MLAYFPGGGVIHPDGADWLAETICKMRADPRIGKDNIKLWRRNDTPITLGRNQACLVAEQLGMDLLVMLDNDLSPDLNYPDAVPFWDTAFDFWVNHKGPCVIAAPYCGPPPFEMPFVFRFVNQETGSRNPDFQLEAYPRDYAATLKGVQRVAALPTGLMMIDMRAVRKLPHPRFYYEWKDDGPVCPHCRVKKPGPQVQKTGTEDVTFSRDLHFAGVPLYATFSSWAGHWKPKLVPKPGFIPDDTITAQIWDRAREVVANEAARNGKPANGKPRKPAAAAAKKPRGRK